MFGYIRTRSGDLKVREDTYYHAAYCGLCRTHGRCTGQCSRCFLSYDFTFLSIVRSVLVGEEPKPEMYRCLLHPAKKRLMLEPTPSSEQTARAAAILNAYKNLDDLRDERGSKRFRAMLVRPFLTGGRRRAEKREPELAALIRDGITEMSRLEKEKIASVDVYAEVFGRIIGGVLSHGLEESAKRIGQSIGFHLGKWVYILDAADDFEQDVKRGRFNPFVLLYGEDSLSEEHKIEIRTALLAELMAAENGFDLLIFPREDDERRGIIRNMIYLGMPDTAERILGIREGIEREVTDGDGPV